MIHDLHAFCCQLAPSVWFWELWHCGSCEWNSNNVIVDVTDTPDDAGTVRKSGPRHTVQHGVIWSARKHDKNSFIKVPHRLFITLNFKEPPQWLAHSCKFKLPDTRTVFKASLLACITKLLCLNWIAGFRAWRVKDNSSRASLAGCQWTMQSRPQLSAAGRAHAGVHIRRDSLCCFDGSVIAASVCPQLGFRYSPPITCYYRRLGSECIFSRLSPFPDVSEGQYNISSYYHNSSPVVFCTFFYTDLSILTTNAKVIQ